jgi:AcrR family transcriptional regulator
MDRRQRKSRQAIFRAFTDLLKKENYSKITVQQIIDLADVGRTTFYSHFETKDDLLESFCSEIFEHVFSDELDKEKTHDFSGEHDTKARITHILYHLQEHIDYLPGILTGDSDAVFMGYFKERLSELFKKAVRESENVPYDYMLNHMVNDFAETIRWWARHGQYSPEEISAFFFATTPGIK